MDYHGPRASRRNAHRRVIAIRLIELVVKHSRTSESDSGRDPIDDNLAVVENEQDVAGWEADLIERDPTKDLEACLSPAAAIKSATSVAAECLRGQNLNDVNAAIDKKDYRLVQRLGKPDGKDIPLFGLASD